MADVASPEGDNGLVAATPEGCRAPLMTETGGANGETGDMAVASAAAADNGVVDDKVSIHEILEGMTNEFNKNVSPTKNEIEKMELEEKVMSLLPSRIVDEVSKRERESDEVSEEAVEGPEDVVTLQTPEVNHKDEEESSPGKQEAVKKDNNIPRIVLTFRTIDENTDHGKKTKISSCSSNLTLVPDELANCDQIGGVSVKIETSDENSDVVEESQAEESQAEESQAEESQTEESKVKESQSEKSQAEETKKKESTKVTESKVVDENKIETAEERQNSDAQLPTQKKSEITENNAENSSAKTTLAEGTAQQETTAPVTRKRRIGRPRLRALSDSVPRDEEPPGPKRSARRLCKESVKTVLESAMARKEKSNYTEEYKKKKYNKPGRPKKIVPGKDPIKQTQVKPSDVRQEMETSLTSDNSTTEMLESSRDTSLPENSMNDNVTEDSQSFSSDFDGMPKLSPMTRSSESHTKLGNSIGSPGSDDTPLADIQKPFLKPATQPAIRPKRERGRPRGSTQAARKIAKADLYEDGSPSVAEAGKNNDYPEVKDVQEEGKYAIDSPGYAANPDMPPEEYALDENEERSMIEPKSLEDSKLQELIFVLIEWINDELADQRIIVKDIVEDLYDGQVLQKLLEKLTGEKLDVPEVTQSEEGQKQKLAVVLSAANRVLGRYPPYKWSVESIHSKNIVAILHLLVGLARLFRAPVRLPERVAVQVVVVRKKDGQLIHRTVREELTTTYDDLGMRCERDAFDTLFDHAPDKLAVVKKSLVTFVNKHLSKVHLEVTDLDTQFHDGVFLILLLGLLEGFFVPLGSFHLTPRTIDQKVHNVSFAFDIMRDIGLPKPKARPEDIVNLDLKSTLRVLYNLFTKYKGIN